MFKYSGTYCTGDNLIGLCRDLERDLRPGAVEVLNPFLVILTELERIREAVKWGHYGSGLQRML